MFKTQGLEISFSGQEIFKDVNVIINKKENFLLNNDFFAFKNKKIRVFGKTLGAFVSSLGAKPALISGSEQYLAYQRGTVDAGMTGVSGVKSRKLYQVMDTLTVTNHGDIEFVLVANQKWLNSLTKKQRKAITEASKIAEKAGASAVMALERIPADIRADGGVARMSSVGVIQEVMDSVSIPVMAKARICHFVEAQILDSLGIDFIDESEVLTPADEVNHINKQNFKAPFVCGATGLGEATRRIAEGASMIRTKGEAGTGNVVEAVRHMRTITNELNEVIACDENQVVALSKKFKAPLNVLEDIREQKKLPVVNFAAGGIATPADAALMMQLGCDGVFVGSGIFKSGDPAERAEAIVIATTNFNDPKVLAEISKDLC